MLPIGRARYNFAVWLVLSLSPTIAHACLVPFAALGTVNSDAAEQTYRELIARLGGSLSVQTLTEMIESKDPFLVPETENRDLGGLQKNLKQFRELLEMAKFNTPEMRQVFLEHLSDLKQKSTHAASKQPQAVLANESDTQVDQITLRDSRFLTAPSSEWIGLEGEARNDDIQLNFYRPGTGQAVQNVVQHKGTSQLSQDGRYLLTVIAGEIQVQPVSNGWIGDAVSFSAPPRTALDSFLALFKSPPPPAPVLQARSLNSPDQVVLETARSQSGLRFELFDLSRGKRTPLTVSGEVGKGFPNRQWGVVPGTDQIYLFYSRNESPNNTAAAHELWFTELDPKTHTLKPTKAPLAFQTRHSVFDHVHAGGGTNWLHVAAPDKFVLAGGSGVSMDVLVKDGANTWKPFAAYDAQRVPLLEGAQFSPAGDTIWFVGWNAGAKRLYAFDTATNQIVYEKETPHDSAYHLSSDGKHMNVYRQSIFKIVNVKKMKQEKP